MQVKAIAISLEFQVHMNILFIYQNEDSLSYQLTI